MFKKLLVYRPVSELKDPFPIEKLRELYFGNADGDRDDLIEEAFVKTQSVQLFLQNRHSIIIGPIGSGKSSLFKLIKNNSDSFQNYKDSLLVPIEEAINFQMLKDLVNKYFENYDEKIIYKVLWKFHIATCLAEKISTLKDYPFSEAEKNVNKFLLQINSKGQYQTIVEKLKSLLTFFKPKIKTKISQTPIEIEAIIGEFENEKMSVEINIDKVIHDCINSIKERRFVQAVILIDKLDKFVADEEYKTQREFIKALLEVEDDLYRTEMLRFKIFVRSDLFSRLNFASLGYDKVMDNALKLEWSNNEILEFMAKRILFSLKRLKLLDEEIIILSTDLTKFDLNGLNILRLLPIIPHKFKKKLFNYDKINKERDTGLSEHINKSIITKVFPRQITHYDSSGNKAQISIFEFLQNHFKDGNNKTTPRRLLRFLKFVQEKAIYYYDNNPDQKADVDLINGDVEWRLFKEKAVYNAYLEAKKDFEINIGNTDDNWTKLYVVFQSKRGNKQMFDFKWLKQILPEVPEDNLIAFLSFLEAIGFLKVQEHNIDIKNRKYGLPILYQRVVEQNV